MNLRQLCPQIQNLELIWVMDHAGNIVLTGYSLSGALGDKTEPCLGHFDFWTVCLNTDRKILWQKTLGTGKEDRTENILQDKNHAYHIGGGSPLNLVGQTSNYFIGILNSKGEFQRTIQPGGDEDKFAISIFQSFDNGIMYGGYSSSGKTGDKSEDSYGDKDGWIIKYDSTGKKIWDKGIGGAKFDVINRIVPYKGTCYYVLMTSQSGKSGNLTQEGKGLSDVLMITLKDKKSKS